MEFIKIRSRLLVLTSKLRQLISSKEKQMSKAHLTAISRKKLSAPMEFLSKEGLLTGEMLDYGSGKGFDADFLGMDKYDSHFQPVFPTKRYDTITCNYVLNVIEEREDRFKVLDSIRNLLKPGGNAFISVRRDKFETGFTRKGTYQCFVALALPVVFHKKGGFVIYRLSK